MSGTLEFSLAIADIDINDVWSAADPGEEVVLEFSTDGGVTYNQLAKYDVDSFASWTDLSVSLPDPIIGSKYQWRQLSYSFGDHWAIDNIVFRDSNGNVIASDNFESGTVSSLFSSISNGVVNTNGNNAPGNGTQSLWFGPNNEARFATTNPISITDPSIDDPLDELFDEPLFRFRNTDNGGYLFAGVGESETVRQNLNGNVEFSPEKIITTDARHAESVYAADLDGDGDTDVLSASWADDKVAWYENDGNTNFTERIISSNAERAHGVFAIDIDGDKDIDVLSAAHEGNNIAWYENDGSANFTEHIISTNAEGAKSVVAIDLDGDGDIDVLSASRFDDKIAWYENDGNTNFTERIISTNAKFANDVHAADVDGDGDTDVLSASIGDSKIAWYENDGNNNFTERIISISTNPNSAESLFAIDVDGDADTDVISASSSDNKVSWYENDGNTNFTERVISSNAANVMNEVFAIDVDGDADIDIFSTFDAPADTVAWYENDGNANFTERVISTNAVSAISVFAIDVDGDGDNDVLSASTLDYKVAWYENLPNYSNFIEEGKAFNVYSKPGDGLIRFNRFRHSNTGGYLFAGVEESEIVRLDYPSFVEEGVAFYAYGADSGLGVDIFRFQNSEIPGSYIFVGEAEKNSIEANYPQFVLEGVAFEAEF